MTQENSSVTLSERLHWDDFIKPWLMRLLFIGIGVVIGFYILAPQQTRASERYLPDSFITIPVGNVQFANAEGSNAFLPVRIADTSTARNNNFKGVGPIALDNGFVLFAQTRETSRQTSYPLTNVRIPLEFAVIKEDGEVVALQEALLGIERISIAENHRWLLAAKTGMLAAYGITVGSILDPESVQKLKL